jgi:uncharacterized RDD family membrane protein YckC
VSDRPPTTLASIGRRIVGRLLDGVIIVVATVVPLLMFFDIKVQDGVPQIPGWMQWSTWAVALLYEIVATAIAGQTIGKRVMGIRVVDATTGAVPTLEQSMRRALPVFLQRVPVIGGFAGLLYLPALWRPRRQGIPDVFASTVVVTVEVRMPRAGGDRSPAAPPEGF